MNNLQVDELYYFQTSEDEKVEGSTASETETPPPPSKPSRLARGAMTSKATTNAMTGLSESGSTASESEPDVEVSKAKKGAGAGRGRGRGGKSKV